MVGTGYLDSLLRVKEITSELNVGAVYWQSRITYLFENDKQYVAQVRIYRGKPYAQLVEDFNLGGASKFIFSYDNWSPKDFISCTDQAQTKHRRIGKHDAHDFVTEEGSTCLVRVVIWSQFGYFNGKSETIGLMNEDGSLAVGGFFVRPDRWTRAKVNHVDLYRRTEVPGDRLTRGVVGLKVRRTGWRWRRGWWKVTASGRSSPCRPDNGRPRQRRRTTARLSGRQRCARHTCGRACGRWTGSTG